MFNKEFLKTLTVMYVEDDANIRDSLGTILNKIFKEVIMCVDGQDGVDKFLQYTTKKNIEIDAIISDINMPKLNGLEMLAKIREVDTEVPVVLTTAHGEANFLMEAIKLNVAYYALKPINTPTLLEHIQKFCLTKHQQKLLMKKEQELTSYIDIIGNVATILRVDANGDFLEVNDMFCEESSYEKEELLKQNISLITHPDIMNSTYKDILNSIASGEKWSGLYKCIDKDEESFYLKLSAVPEFDDSSNEVKGSVLIGFIATDEEQEKRDTMQKVRQSIIEHKKREVQLKQQIKQLEAQLDAVPSADATELGFLQSSLEKYKLKNTQLLTQIKHYEKGIATLEHRLANIAEAEMSKRQDLMERNKVLQQENITMKENLITTKNLLNKCEKRKAKS